MRALQQLGVWIGGAALLAATMIDTLAVVGRNIGWPMIGSIELVQAAVLVSGTVGLIFATAGDEHAHVRVLTDRFRRGPAFAGILAPVAMALFFAALLAGSVWLAADLWSGYERSELLGVPWSVLRLIANGGLAICIIVALAGLVRRVRP